METKLGASIEVGRNLGVLIGPVLLAQAIHISGDWGVVAPLFGLICLVALLLAAMVVRRRPNRPGMEHTAMAVACGSAEKE